MDRHQSIAERFADISRGLVNGSEPFGGYGERTTAGAVTNGVIWPDGAYNVPPAAGVQMSFVSTSAQDGVGGTGIRTLHVHYLDANLDPQVADITLNGLTPVLSVVTNIRFIQCMHLETYGSDKAAAGTITATNGGTVYSQINTGDVRCSSSARMVPRGMRCMVQAFAGGSASGAAAASTVVRIAATYIDGHNYTQDAVFIPYGSAAAQDGSSTLGVSVPLAFPEGVIVGMIFSTDKAATVVGTWFGWLEKV